MKKMTYRILSTYLFAFWAFFAFRTITELPVGYLHSWNQITSLSFVDSVREVPERWYETRDVTTRVTWEKEGTAIDGDDRYQRFIVYEEFPLYHILAAALADGIDVGDVSSGISSSVLASRALSLVFFLATVAGLLCRKGPLIAGERFFLLFIIASSFPLVYYSTAPMSDVAMTCAMVYSCLFLEKYSASQSNQSSRPWGGVWFFLSVTSLGIAALFKSYAVMWMPALIVQFIVSAQVIVSARAQRRGKVSYQSLAGAMLLVIAASLPVFAWHFLPGGFLPRETGQSEVFSHVLGQKMEVIFSGQIITILWKIWFRYFGYLTGALTLSLLVLKYVLGMLKDSRILPLSIPSELTRLAVSTKIVIFPAERNFLIFSLVYLFLSADKLPYHDYYFFPVVILLSPVVSRVLAQVAAGLRGMLANYKAEVIICGFVVVSTGISGSKIFKAQHVNSDVVNCANFIRDSTADNELIATWTDVSRYNSITYLSGRKAVNVEGTAFHPNRYRRAGASVLVIDLPEREFPAAHVWAASHGVSAPYLIQAMSVREGGARERVCALYRLSGGNR